MQEHPRYLSLQGDLKLLYPATGSTCRVNLLCRGKGEGVGQSGQEVLGCGAKAAECGEGGETGVARLTYGCVFNGFPRLDLGELLRTRFYGRSGDRWT